MMFSQPEIFFELALCAGRRLENNVFIHIVGNERVRMVFARLEETQGKNRAKWIGELSNCFRSSARVCFSFTWKRSQTFARR